MFRDSDFEIILNRKYQDGDIVEFYFEPNTIDIRDFYTVKLTGIITGIFVEYENRIYTVQIRDDGRDIHGSVTIPEKCIINKNINKCNNMIC